MRVVRVAGIAAVAALLLVGPPARAQDRAAPTLKPIADSGPTAANLIAFVGRKLEARLIEHKIQPKPGRLPLWTNADFLLRYEVLQVVFGRYQKKEIAFHSYVHNGRPVFEDHDYSLVYVWKQDAGYVNDGTFFQPLYPTAGGRWAGCGDPYDGGERHGSGVKAEPIRFQPAVTFDIRNVPELVRERKYPLPLFRYEGDTAVCEMGNYPDALFRVMKEGPLRGAFMSSPPR